MRPIVTIFIYLASVFATTPLAIPNESPDTPTCNCCCSGIKICRCGCMPAKDDSSQPTKFPKNKRAACFCNGQQTPLVYQESSARLAPQKCIETAYESTRICTAQTDFSSFLNRINCGPPPDQPILQSTVLLI